MIFAWLVLFLLLGYPAAYHDVEWCQMVLIPLVFPGLIIVGLSYVPDDEEEAA